MNTARILKRFKVQGEIPSSSELYSHTIHIAWPAILESFLISMTGFVDTIMVSSVGTAAIAAIGLTDQPKFIGLSSFFALGTAISAIVARRRGEEDRQSANKVLRMALFVGTILCIILSLALFFGADFIIRLAGSASDTHDDAVSYFQIISLGMILTTTTMIINSAHRGAGNTKISMITNITANAVNVVFNYLLIEGHFGFPALGVNGAAIATVLGAGVGCVISIISITNPNTFIYFGNVSGYIASKKDIHSAIGVGGSALAEQVFLRIGFFLFAMTVARLGTTALSAHMIGMKFMSISFSFADGLAVASVALVGRSLGEKRQDMALIYANVCQRIGLFCAFVVSIIFFFGGRLLFSIFTDEVVILDYGEMIMRVLCLVIYMQIVQVATMGCLRGAGDTKFTAIISFVSVAIIRPLASWFFCEVCHMGLFGIWLGLSADQTLRFLLSLWRFKRAKWIKINV